MKYSKEIIQPSASDFGRFVYCGAKLFLDTSPTLESFRKAKHASYNISKQGRSLLIGQNNEHRCIEWLMKNNKEAQNNFFMELVDILIT